MDVGGMCRWNRLWLFYYIFIVSYFKICVVNIGVCKKNFKK